MHKVTLYTVKAETVQRYGLSELKYLATQKLTRVHNRPPVLQNEVVYLGTEITVPITTHRKDTDSPVEYFAVSPELQEMLESPYKEQVRQHKLTADVLKIDIKKLQGRLWEAEALCKRFLRASESFNSANVFKRIWLAIKRKEIYV